jgi:hypothetical protein
MTSNTIDLEDRRIFHASEWIGTGKKYPIGYSLRSLPFSGQILAIFGSLSLSGRLFGKKLRSLSFRTKNPDSVADKKPENG